MHVRSPAGEAASARNFAFRADIKRECARLNVRRDVLRDHRFRALVPATQENVHRAVVFEKPRLGHFRPDLFLVIRRELVLLRTLFAVVNRNPVEGMLLWPDRRGTSNGVLTLQNGAHADEYRRSDHRFYYVTPCV